MLQRNLRDKREWAVLKHLGKLSGTGPLASLTYQRLPEGLSDGQRATAIAEAGENALMLVIESAGDFAGRNVTASVWKAVTAETGSRSALLLAHGLAATTARLASYPGHHLNADRHLEARELLSATFPWPDADDNVIGRALDEMDTAGSDIETVRLDLAVGALSLILSPDAVRALPALAPYRGEDAAEEYAVALHWRICWNHAQPPYLRVVDPDGLASWEDSQSS
jgi:hypothetical protein